MKRSSGGCLAVLLGVMILVGGIGWFVWERCGLQGCPDLERLSGYVPDEASVVLDARGQEVAKLYRVRRVIISLADLPAHVPSAFVAIEDQRFWEHRGIDWTRVLGAAWANVRAREIQEGSSTITMQLARNVFPDRLPYHERTFSRKIAEMRVAWEIERRFSKHQILELYLNQIYFGSGAWGIEAAAQEYFGRPAAELSLGEAAMLAGVIRAPHRLNPRTDPRGATGRQRVVLERMVQQGLVSREAATAAAAAELSLSRGESIGGYPAPYYVEEVRQLLESQLGEALYTEGYRIFTALDPSVQAVAEEELERQISGVEAGRYGRFLGPVRQAAAAEDAIADASDPPERTRYLQGGVVVMDAASGNVLAMVGGRDFAESRFNRATQARRQPGSAFKPFVYAAALSEGFPPTMPLDDGPIRRVMADGSVWEPRNFGGGHAGTVTMRNALTHSRNLATIRLAEEVGLPSVIDTARRLGLEGPIPRVPSIVIGAAEATLMEMTAAYATFATLGLRPEPRLVLRVEDRRGRIVWDRPPRSRRALDPAVAFLTTSLLRDVVDRGTGTGVRAAGFVGPAAGKTGTTNEATDDWFVGYTPRRVTGVWIGFDRPRTVVGGATGGGLAAPAWGRIMRRTGNRAQGDWIPPSGIEALPIDDYGRIIDETCPTLAPTRAEYFLAGAAPPACGRGAPWDDRSPDPAEDGPDLLGEPAEPVDDSPGWWQRMRQRILGDDEPGASPRPAEPPARPPEGPAPLGEPAPSAPGPPGSGEEPRGAPDRPDPSLPGGHPTDRVFPGTGQPPPPAEPAARPPVRAPDRPPDRPAGAPRDAAGVRRPDDGSGPRLLGRPAGP